MVEWKVYKRLVLKLKDGFVLYHGSYCEVKEPDLAKCAKRKDFGQGFYLTTSKDQAIRKQTISASDSCYLIN